MIVWEAPLKIIGECNTRKSRKCYSSERKIQRLDVLTLLFVHLVFFWGKIQVRSSKLIVLFFENWKKGKILFNKSFENLTRTFLFLELISKNLFPGKETLKEKVFAENLEWGNKQKSVRRKSDLAFKYFRWVTTFEKRTLTYLWVNNNKTSINIRRWIKTKKTVGFFTKSTSKAGRRKSGESKKASITICLSIFGIFNFQDLYFSFLLILRFLQQLT